MATVIRECVDAGLGDAREERRRRWDRMASIVGAFSDRKGAKDVARHHDKYLEDAYR